jgi:hypothetical protein
VADKVASSNVTELAENGSILQAVPVPYIPADATMASDTAASLRLLECSGEMLELEAALQRKRTDVLSDLRSLENSPELTALSEKLYAYSCSNILEVVEGFGRINRYDEHLHSRFLEFFLTPREQRHGLSDTFLKALLRKARFFCSGSQTSTREPDYGGDFTDTEIKREAVSEQGRADFKIRNGRQNLVLLIENKTLSSEGHRQLARYWEDAEREDPSFAIGGLFLTPNGNQPETASKYGYVAVSYCEIAELLDECVQFRGKEDSGAVLARQYASAIRRWFVEDPEIRKLAWRIYKKYPAAASYISTDEAKPSGQIFEHLHGLITEQESGLVTITKRKSELWFVPSKWDEVESLRRAGTKDADGRLLIFWFSLDNEAGSNLDLYLGTAPGAHPDVIARLIATIGECAPPKFHGLVLHNKPRPQSWTHLWGRRFMVKEEIASEDQDEVFKSLEVNWQRFLGEEFPKIMEAVNVASHRQDPRQNSG